VKLAPGVLGGASPLRCKSLARIFRTMLTERSESVEYPG